MIMQFFVGIDERGVIIKEGRVDSDPIAIARFIRHRGRRVEHVGLEAGSLPQWLHAGLVQEGFRVTVMEARHVRAAFAAMRVKTDRNDARGIAQLVRLGWFKAVHVKAPSAQETRTLLNARSSWSTNSPGSMTQMLELSSDTSRRTLGNPSEAGYGAGLGRSALRSRRTAGFCLGLPERTGGGDRRAKKSLS
jgi:hypothetical protein